MFSQRIHSYTLLVNIHENSFMFFRRSFLIFIVHISIIKKIHITLLRTFKIFTAEFIVKKQ